MAETTARYERADGDNTTYLVVEGEIDLANVCEFNRHLARLVGEARSPAVLDLRGLTFFGSTALNAVIAAHTCAETRGVQLRIRPSPLVLRVIHVAGLDSTLHIG